MKEAPQSRWSSWFTRQAKARISLEDVSISPAIGKQKELKLETTQVQAYQKHVKIPVSEPMVSTTPSQMPVPEHAVVTDQSAIQANLPQEHALNIATDDAKFDGTTDETHSPSDEVTDAFDVDFWLS